MHWIYSFYSIAHGILASTASFIFFFLLGAACLPQRLLTTCRFPFFIGLVGLAVFSITCFYGLQYNISLYNLFQFFPLVLIPILIIRRSLLLSCIDNFSTIKTLTKTISTWWLIYILLYILVFIFIPEPDPRYYLPIEHTNNTDIFNYINITQDMLFLKDSHMAQFYLHPFDQPYSQSFWAYYQTPGVFYFNAWMALFYGGNALNAAMPILYTTVSLVGLMITYYCHHFFRCSRWISAGIAAIVLSGSFYRLIIGFYFLSSLMGTVVWLASIISLLQWDFSKKLNSRTAIQFVIILACPLCLLLVLYPIFFWNNLPILGGMIVMLLLLQKKKFPLRPPLTKGEKVVYLVLLPLAAGLVTAILPQAIEYSINNILWQANRSDVLWVLPLLSPFSILGFPCHFALIEGKSIFVIFVLVMFGLFYCFHQVSKKSSAKDQNQAPIYVLFTLVIGAFCVYWLYFYLAGPLRYQPWKFASYFIVPLAGIFWALFFKTLSYCFKSYRKIFAGLLIFCLLGNFFFYYFKLLEPSKNKYLSLTALNVIEGQQLVTKMSNFSGTYLAKFFIRHKQLHSLNYSYYKKESLTNVSDHEPFFVESPHGCEYSALNKKSMLIHPLGCLYFGIPLLTFEKHYSFIDNLPFIETNGLFEFFVETPKNKRWAGPTGTITFYVDQEILKQHPNGYFNFQVTPFEKKQRVFITWGKNNHAFKKVTSKKWISLPYTSEDWSSPNASRQLKKITFQFRLPDAKSPHQLNAYDLDMHYRSIDFIQFFMNDNSLPSPEGIS